MKQDFIKQLTDASTIQQIINLVNRILSNTLFYFEAASIAFAVSRFRLI